MSEPVEFKIDKSTFDDLSLNALRGASVAFFDENELSGQERLFYRLWASKILKTVVFIPDQIIQKKDSVPDDAYVVVSGEVQVVDELQEYRFGPGTVIGMAEGLCDLPVRHEYKAVSAVSCKIIPIDTACREIVRINSGLKGICRFTVERVLGKRTVLPDFLR
jgi:CRP-like cAMP-binding protein